MTKRFIIARSHELELGQRELRIDNSRRRISTRVEAGLSVFLASQQRVLSKDELLDAIWPNRDVSEASLFRLIHEIRAILDPLASNGQSIESVYGKGYRLNLNVVLGSEQSIEYEPGRPERSTPRRWGSLLAASLAAFACFVALVFMLAKGPSDSRRVEQLPEHVFEDLAALSETRRGMAQQRLDDLLADDAGYHPLDRARLQHLRATNALRAGEFDLAAELIDEALLVAAQQEAEALEADLHFISVRLHKSRGDLSRAWHALREAKALYAELGQGDKLLRVDNAQGLLLYKEGRYREAIAVFQRLADAAKAAGAQSELVGADGNIASSYGQLRNWQQASVFAKRCLDAALASDDPKYIGNAYALGAMVELETGQLADGMNWVGRAIRFSATRDDFLEFVQHFHFFCRYLVALQHHKLSNQYLPRLLKVADWKASDKLSVSALTLSGISAYSQERHGQALEYFSSALEALPQKRFALERHELQVWLGFTELAMDNPYGALQWSQRLDADELEDDKQQTLARLLRLSIDQALGRATPDSHSASEILESLPQHWFRVRRLGLNLLNDNAQQSRQQAELAEAIERARQASEPSAAVLADIDAMLAKQLQN